MNLNPMLMQMGERLEIPVEEDEYSGHEEKYMIFSYEDEKPVFFGDDHPIADTAYVMLQLVVPKEYNYFGLKKGIREELECMGFSITGIHSLFGSAVNGTKKIRRIIFETSYTEMRTGGL